MKKLKSLPTLLGVVFAVACLHISASGQANDQDKFAKVSTNGSVVRWDVAVPHASSTLTVSAPDGQVFRKEFKAGTPVEFALTDREGNRLSDGEYNYELRLTLAILSEVRKELAAARAKGGDDDDAAAREMRKRGLLPARPSVQSGAFSILRGAVTVEGSVEDDGRQASTEKATRHGGLSQTRRRVRSEAFSNQKAAFIPASTFGDLVLDPAVRMALPSSVRPAFFDFVIADDLIVQGSACVGLDCVNGEVFNFDTIRMKENNTRLAFNDTSTSAGFPTRDWRIRANSSASGGLSAFFIDDMGDTSTGSEPVSSTPFTIESGALTNSVYVDSTSRVGFRTSTPVLDIHTNTGNTPAIRLEQNNAGGFTAQTWDIAGNEANFFIRDVTSGSALPFRIRPGAPTSSIDISADGDVGIGTASPGADLDVNADTGTATIFVSGGSGGGANVGQLTFNRIGTGELGRIEVQRSGSNDQSFMAFFTKTTAVAAAERMRIDGNGRVGIATTAPTDTLSVNGTASKPGGGSWAVFSDERLKTIKGRFNSGLGAVMQLQPLRYEYRRNNALGINSEGEHVGFGAQALQKIIPEAVIRNENGYLLVNNDPILWTMLNAIKEQQKEIEQLKAQIRQLQPRAGGGNRTRHRRR